MHGENSFAGKPSFTGLARYYEITLGVLGKPDTDTGYLIGIQELDNIVRTHLVPLILRQCEADACIEPASMLQSLWNEAAAQSPHALSMLRWSLSPYYQIEMTSDTQSSGCVLMRQRFEFAAAHRLHTPTLSNEENARFFGKCNNPSGHGHNYQIEPCIRVPIERASDGQFQLYIQQAVNRAIIDPLDHKFLNTDVDWFDQSNSGLIPSVENIARICYEQLAPEIRKLGQDVELLSIQAWETEKTSAIYPG